MKLFPFPNPKSEVYFENVTYIWSGLSSGSLNTITETPVPIESWDATWGDKDEETFWFTRPHVSRIKDVHHLITNDEVFHCASLLPGMGRSAYEFFAVKNRSVYCAIHCPRNGVHDHEAQTAEKIFQLHMRRLWQDLNFELNSGRMLFEIFRKFEVVQSSKWLHWETITKQRPAAANIEELYRWQGDFGPYWLKGEKPQFQPGDLVVEYVHGNEHGMALMRRRRVVALRPTGIE